MRHTAVWPRNKVQTHSRKTEDAMITTQFIAVARNEAEPVLFKDSIRWAL